MRIINDILDFSKIEAGRLEMESEEFLLEQLFDKVTAVVTERSQRRRLEFLLQTAPDVPASLVGDALRLGQVLINLCSNAVKFTDAGRSGAVDRAAQPRRRVAACCASASATPGSG